MSEDSNKGTPPANIGQYEWTGTLRRRVHRRIPRLFSKKAKHNWIFRDREYYATIEIFVPFPEDYRPTIRMAMKFMAEKYVYIDFESIESLESFVTKLNAIVTDNDLVDAFEEAKQRSSK